VATGRALLAFQPRAEIERVLSGPLPAYTQRSVTRPPELDALLDQVRRDGYAVNHSSYREGVGGVAAPVRDYTGSPVASVGICLPEQRFGADRFDALREATVDAAIAISAALGGPAAPVLAGSEVKAR
jgi:DNA-binding IclR family transcriptional regulator